MSVHLSVCLSVLCFFLGGYACFQLIRNTYCSSACTGQIFVAENAQVDKDIHCDRMQYDSI